MQLMTKKVFSIKYKLVLLLLFVSLGGLFFYGVMSLNIFIKDKKTYIYDTAEIVAKTLANQVRVELDVQQKILDPIEASIDTAKFQFTGNSNELFKRQKRVEHVFIYLPTTGSAFQQMDHLYLPDRVVKKFSPGGEVIEGLLSQAMAKGFAIQEVKSNKRYFAVVNKYRAPVTDRDYLILSVFGSPSLYESFATPSAYRHYLLSKNQFMAMEPKYKTRTQASLQIASADFFQPIYDSQFPTGVAEIENHARKTMLVSFSRVGVSDLIVAAVADKAKSMYVIEEIKWKSLFFFATTLSLALLIGLVASQGLVSSVAELQRVVTAYTRSDYAAFSTVNSDDELGSLSADLNNLGKKLNSGQPSTGARP